MSILLPTIVWVGLSAKPGESGPLPALCPSTRSGALIEEVVQALPRYQHVRTNLVPYAPLSEAGKLRYPTAAEMRECVPALRQTLDSMQDPIVVLLGRKVADQVLPAMGERFRGYSGFEYSCSQVGERWVLPIHHPSYVSIYKRKHIPDYASGIAAAIKALGSLSAAAA